MSEPPAPADDDVVSDLIESGAPDEVVDAVRAEMDADEQEQGLVLLAEHGRLIRWLQDAGMPFRRTPLGTVDGFSRSELIPVAGAIGIGRKRLRALLMDLRLVERGMRQALAARKQR